MLKLGTARATVANLTSQIRLSRKVMSLQTMSKLYFDNVQGCSANKEGVGTH